VARDPVWEQPRVLDAVFDLRCSDIDVLVVYVLHGMSAEQQTLAGVKSEVPTVLWALPTNYSFSSCISARGALRDRGRKVALVFSPDDDSRAVAEIEMAARAAYAMEQLKRCRIGTLGGIFPNLPADQYHRDTVADKVGPQVVHLPVARLRQQLDAVSPEDEAVVKEMARLRKRFDVRVDDALLGKAARIDHALRRLSREERLNAICLECHTELAPLFGINPCLGFADESCPYIPVCEGDVVRGVNALMLHLLTGEVPCMGDAMGVRDGILTLSHCGAPCAWGSDGDVVIAEQRAPAHVGVETKLAMCRPMIGCGRVTLTRLHGQELEQLHVGVGDIVDASNDDLVTVRVGLANADGFLDGMCGNHYLIAGGDVRSRLGLLCEWLGIEVIET